MLGAVFLVMGAVGWFREVLPHEAHEALVVEPGPQEAPLPFHSVRHLQVGEEGHRAILPLQIYPYSAGIWGGLVGGLAMIFFALLYGLVVKHSIWYPVNLLAASGSATISAMSDQELLAFNAWALVLAIVIHVLGCVLIGLLYGIALPMFPHHPALFGGILAPIFWSGILYASIGIFNPTLQSRISWGWFMLAQFAFGLVAGFVVARREKISTFQHLPFAMRAGFEAPGLEGAGEEDPKS